MVCEVACEENGMEWHGMAMELGVWRGVGEYQSSVQQNMNRKETNTNN